MLSGYHFKMRGSPVILSHSRQMPVLNGGRTEKDLVRCTHGLIEVARRDLPGRTEESHESFSYDNRCPGQDSKRAERAKAGLTCSM